MEKFLPRCRIGARHALIALLLGTATWPGPVSTFSQSPSQTPSQAPTAPAAEQAPTVEAAGAPVVVGGRTLFYVQERMYSFSPQDRSAAISARIARLFRDPTFSVASVRVADQETATDIVAGDLVVMTVTDNDARAAGLSRINLAERYAAQIRSVGQELQREYSLRSVLLGILWASLATALLLLIVRLLAYAFPKLYSKLDAWRGTKIRSIRIQKLELLTADRITDSLIVAARGMRILATLLLLYFYLPLALSFFPWTRGWAAVLFEYVLGPVRAVGSGIANYLPNLFFIAVIAIAAYYAIRVLRFIFNEIGKGTLELPGFYRDWAEPTYKIGRFLIIAFTSVVMFPYLPGSGSPAFQGVSIFLALLFSLGSTTAVANIVAGTVLTYTRAFQVGDRVQIGDTVGDVTAKTLLVTRVRTIKNVDVSVPNSMVLGSHIINFSSSAQRQGLILHTRVTIGYDAPWRQVHSLLLTAAEATANILSAPKPFVLQTSLDDFYVTYELNAFTEQPNLMAATYSELHQNIQDKFNEAGVEITSPHFEALRDGNATAIPAEYLPKDYRAPGFRVGPPKDPPDPATNPAKDK